MGKDSTRRSFLKKAVLGSTAVTSAPHIFANSYEQKIVLPTRKYNHPNYAANDYVSLGLIGAGIQGIYDTMAALEVAGVKLVAACDLYTGRLDRAKELWGKDIWVNRDYRALLARKDIDAVIVATPDHWHKKITIDAMKAGKSRLLRKTHGAKVFGGA